MAVLGIRDYTKANNDKTAVAGGPFGLLVIAVVAGVISGVAEALGALFNTTFGFLGS
jgi:hypothetical protein